MDQPAVDRSWFYPGSRLSSLIESTDRSKGLYGYVPTGLAEGSKKDSDDADDIEGEDLLVLGIQDFLVLAW
jgi:hypothetical protein